MFPDIVKRLPELLIGWIQPNLSAFLGARLPKIWLVSLAIGITIGLAAIGFREAIGLVQLLWLNDASENVASAARKVPWYVVLLAPAIGG